MSAYLAEHSCTAIIGDWGEIAVVGQGVDKVDVPVSSPVEAEYDEVVASSTDGLPFRKSLQRGEKKEKKTLLNQYLIRHFSSSRTLSRT